MRKPQTSPAVVRSTSLSIRFANTGKRDGVREFLAEYARVVALFCERYWLLAQTGKLSSMPNTALCKAESWLTQRVLQCAAKQASGIVRGVAAKNQRRLFVAEKLWQEGSHKSRVQSKRLRDLANRAQTSAPEIGQVEAQLDARFFKLEKSVGRVWQYWLTLQGFDSRTRNRKVRIPLKATRHSKKLSAGGIAMQSLRLSSDAATLAFSMAVPAAQAGTTLGVDVGLNATLSTSAGVQHRAGNHGWTLAKVTARMARRRKGSRAFERTAAHRDNIIRESVNRLNLHGVAVLRLENIKGMKRGKRVSRKLSHWSSRDIFAALEQKAERCGVRIERCNPRWTSQRCSSCGWVRKRNRKGEQFECSHCGNAMNADLNAALNIAASLPVLPATAVRERWNLAGFFWNPARTVVREAHESASKSSGRDIVREARKARGKSSLEDFSIK